MPAVLYGNTDIVDDNGNFIYHRRLSPPCVVRDESYNKEVRLLTSPKPVFANAA